ncbi:MAG: cupin domain-containing protein [Acidobacteria bacterium]|nr:cupin domain-containing protein [Acidobacteriota bacterium]
MRVLTRKMVLTGAVLLLSSSLGDGQVRFRPRSERLQLGKKSAYQKWLEAEGIPVHQGSAIPDVKKLELGPWKRLGARGAYIFLEGCGGVVDAYLLEVSPGKQTNPERHIFEENFLVLEGSGETHVWQPGKSRQVVAWKKGSIFSPPLNTWHQHSNNGAQPAKLLAVTGAPLLLDLLRDPKFVYGVNYDFTDRYNGQPNYFDPEISRDYESEKGQQHALSIVNIVRDGWGIQLFPAGQGVNDIDRHFILSDNTMDAHIEEFPVGEYERAHRHGPGASIIILNGSGYTLMWPSELGERPYANGHADKIVKLEWQEGSFIIPPIQWYHQHFNNGKEPARWLKLGYRPGNDLYPMTMEYGGDTVLLKFADEDPQIRKQFEEELAKHGAKMQMPPRDELIRLEKESAKLTGSR